MNPALKPDDGTAAWNPVIGWPQYEVSDGGEIRKVGGEALKQWANTDGYMLARLNKPRAVVRVHRVVAEAFIPNSDPSRRIFINHIDCNPANNAASNLEWCTQKENLEHSDRLGRMRRNHWAGNRSPNAQLSDEQVRAIRRMHASGGYSWGALANQFEISKRAIGKLLKRETYSDVQ